MRQIAYIVGNQNYINASKKLKSPINDAEEMKQALSTLKFEVVEKEDLSRQDFFNYLISLGTDGGMIDTLLLYFAGHGFSFEGTNYLAAKDTDFSDFYHAEVTSIKLDDVLNLIYNKKPKRVICILDACRSAFQGERGSGNEFVPIKCPKNVYICFASANGCPALEVTSHGFFTKAILNHINIPNLKIQELFAEVAEEVDIETNGQQVPWTSCSLTSPYCFFPSESANPSEAESGPYSPFAIADENYVFQKGGPLYEIGGKLRFHNWNVQNPAMTNFLKIQDLSEASHDDLFAIGRTLYSCSENVYSIDDFFTDLKHSLGLFPEEVQTHILNGMVFEAYFDHNGDLRPEFRRYNFEKVLDVLLDSHHSNCVSFISGWLAKYESRLMYVPKEEKKPVIHFDVMIERTTDTNLPFVKDIYLEGHSIMKDNNIGFVSVERNIKDFYDYVERITLFETNDFTLSFFEKGRRFEESSFQRPCCFSLVKGENVRR